MNITKTALALQEAEGVSPEELALINTWSKKPLTAVSYTHLTLPTKRIV